MLAPHHGSDGSSRLTSVGGPGLISHPALLASSAPGSVGPCSSRGPMGALVTLPLNTRRGLLVGRSRAPAPSRAAQNRATWGGRPAHQSAVRPGWRPREPLNSGPVERVPDGPPARTPSSPPPLSQGGTWALPRATPTAAAEPTPLETVSGRFTPGARLAQATRGRGARAWAATQERSPASVVTEGQPHSGSRTAGRGDSAANQPLRSPRP